MPACLGDMVTGMVQKATRCSDTIRGIAVDGSGNVYVSESRRLDSQDRDQRDGEHYSRSLVSVGVSGRVWHQCAVSIIPRTLRWTARAISMWPTSRNLGNNLIRKLAPDTTGTNWLVSTLAGQAGVMGFADGVGTNALFSAPKGVAVAYSGNLYVGDDGNDVVRKLALDSTGTNWVVSTVAGRGY